MPIRATPFLPLFLVLCTTCQDETTLITSSAGIPGPLSVERVVRIGSVDDPDQILTQIGEVVIGPNGDLFVAQPLDQTIRVFDAAGKSRNPIGRSGQGPGEFTYLGPIGIHGDTLYTSGGGRVEYFSLDGRHLKTQRWTPDAFRTPDAYFEPKIPQAFALARDASSYVVPGASASAHTGLKPGVTNGVFRIPILRIDAKGRIVDTAYWHETRGAMAVIMEHGIAFTMQSPFGGSALARLIPDGSGIAIVDRSPRLNSNREPVFQIAVIQGPGDTAAVRWIPYQPLPMRPEDVRWALQRDRVPPINGVEPPSDGSFNAAFQKAHEIPTTRYPVTALAAGQDGTIWLRREEQAGDSVAWLVLNRDCSSRGQITLPAGQTVVAATGDDFIALESDSLDVQYLVRYRMH